MPATWLRALDEHASSASSRTARWSRLVSRSRSRATRRWPRTAARHDRVSRRPDHCRRSGDREGQALSVEDAHGGRGGLLSADDRLGTLEVGKLADIVVLDEDHDVAHERLGDIAVDLTILGGEIVYRAARWAPRRHVVGQFAAMNAVWPAGS